MSYFGYCEWPEFYSESFPKAAKEHRCCECSAPIERGEKHLYYRGKWDGDFSTGRQHELCREVCMYIRDKYQGGECFAFGHLFETWGEFFWNKPIEGNGHLQFDARDVAVRGMMAKVKWRHRKYRTLRKKTLEAGKLTYWKKKWGQPWEISQ